MDDRPIFEHYAEDEKILFDTESDQEDFKDGASGTNPHPDVQPILRAKEPGVIYPSSYCRALIEYHQGVLVSKTLSKDAISNLIKSYEDTVRRKTCHLEEGVAILSFIVQSLTFLENYKDKFAQQFSRIKKRMVAFPMQTREFQQFLVRHNCQVSSQFEAIPLNEIRLVCGHCQKKDVLNRCTQCRLVFYCDADCQKKHWKSHHKTVCDPKLKL